jgi:protease I
MNPDKLRMDANAVAFVKAFFDAKKPIAAICHGPWMVIEAGAAKGRTLTSWPSLQTDIQNAGGRWVDQEAVVDGNLVTSRNPKDIPAFNREVAKLFSTAQSRAA